MEQSFSEQGLQIYFVRQSESPSEHFLEAFKVSASLMHRSLTNLIKTRMLTLNTIIYHIDLTLNNLAENLISEIF